MAVMSLRVQNLWRVIEIQLLALGLMQTNCDMEHSLVRPSAQQLFHFRWTNSKYKCRDQSELEQIREFSVRVKRTVYKIKGNRHCAFILNKRGVGWGFVVEGRL